MTKNVRKRKMEEEKGSLLDSKRELRMELKRNSGIGWYRSLQIRKHLDMYERGRNSQLDSDARIKIQDLIELVELLRFKKISEVKHHRCVSWMTRDLTFPVAV